MRISLFMSLMRSVFSQSGDAAAVSIDAGDVVIKTSEVILSVDVETGDRTVISSPYPILCFSPGVPVACCTGPSTGD